MDATAVEKLPCESISSSPIREAVIHLKAARSAREELRKDLIELENTREASEWADAKVAEESRSVGKVEPKRSKVAEHDRRTDAARHELKVAALGETRCLETFQAALSDHGRAWAQEVDQTVEELHAEWEGATVGLSGLHSRFSAALAVARVVVGEMPQIGVLRFPARSIKELEIAAGQRDPHGIIALSDVLAGLAALGNEEPPEPEPVQEPVPTRHGSNLLRGRSGVEDEVAERRVFAELAAAGL